MVAEPSVNHPFGGTRDLLKLEPYNGDKGTWTDWRWQFLVTIRAMDRELERHFKLVEQNPTRDYTLGRMSETEKALADKAYTVLAVLLKEGSKEFIRNCEDNNGFMCWAQLCRARQTHSAEALLNSLMNPMLQSDDPRQNIAAWRRQSLEYESRTGERISDNMKRSIFQNKIAPVEIRQHLLLNRSKLLTSEVVADEIEEYQEALDLFLQSQAGVGIVAAATSKGKA